MPNQKKRGLQGRRIWEQREILGISRDELAGFINLTAEQLSEIEKKDMAVSSAAHEKLMVMLEIEQKGPSQKCQFKCSENFAEISEYLLRETILKLAEKLNTVDLNPC